MKKQRWTLLARQVGGGNKVDSHDGYAAIKSDLPA